MTFKIHNTIEVLYDGKKVFSPNAVIDVRTYLNSNKAFAKYIRMGSGTSFSVCKAAVLQNINCDITKGLLNAEYCASILEDESVGKTFSFFGLSENGTDMINSAEIEPIIKEKGKSIDVCVRIYLELDDPNFAFAAGDNPLARFLLGAVPLNGSLSAYGSDNNHYGSYIGFEPMGTAFAANMVFGNNKISFECTIPIEIPGLLITLDDKPILKYFIYQSITSLASVARNLPSDRVLNGGEYDVALINNCLVGSTSIGGVGFSHGFEKIYKCNGIFGYGIGADAKIKSDVTNKFAAAFQKGLVMFFMIVGNKPCLAWSKVCSDDVFDFAVTRGGYLVLFGDNVKIYDYEGTVYSTYGIKSGEKNQITFEGAAFQYITTKENGVKRYKLTETGFSELSGIDNINPELGDDYFTSLIAAPGKSVYATTSSTLNSSSPLNTLFTKFGNVTNVIIGTNIAFVETSSPSQPNKLTAIMDSANVDIDKNAQVRLSGGIALVDLNGVKTLYFYNRGTKEFVEVGGDALESRITQACLLGEYLLAIDSKGIISAYFCPRKNVFYYAPGFASGGKVTIVVTRRNYTYSNSLAAKVTFEVSF